MFVPHSKDFLKNLGDFTGFYRRLLIVPPIVPRIRGENFWVIRQARGKLIFKSQGCETFSTGGNDFRKSSRELLFYMDYLLITDFQKIFMYNEFPLKL